MIVETSVSAGLSGDFYSNGAGKQVSAYFGFGLMNAENLVGKQYLLASRVPLPRYNQRHRKWRRNHRYSGP
ncbi:hypothetical protein DPMN_100079 [Dreissena polymorpha]|uniref:Uncharacterized protein n=1 Tax=Dreissena polymorpha TaxID=45954 RepID=A0A9D4LHJ3_DREPO|nr:hypothetical protein DPMN_100079 [Dreissena polymorpha]